MLLVSHHIRQTSVRDVEAYQRTFARVAVSAGADLVFGHGAHVNQPVEAMDWTAGSCFTVRESRGVEIEVNATDLAIRPARWAGEGTVKIGE